MDNYELASQLYDGLSPDFASKICAIIATFEEQEAA